MDTAENDLIRRKLRCQLAIGHRQVSKHLERDELSVVLVWGGAQPSIITDSLVPLAATRSCPALCLQSLMPKIKAATGLTSLVALGFKNPQPGLDDFKDFISMATELAPPLQVPWAMKKKESKKKETADSNSEEMRKDDIDDDDEEEDDREDGDEDGGIEEEGTVMMERDEEPVKENNQNSTQSAVDWPATSESEEQQILDRLTSLFAPYKDVLKVRRKKFQNAEWKSKKDTLRVHILTDVATIRDAARAGRLTMLLMQRDVLPNPTVSAAAMAAVEGDCPVLCLARLKEVMSPVLRNPLLSAIGFRKCDEGKQNADFVDFVAFAKQLAPKDLKRLLPKKEPVADVSAAAHSKSAKKPPIPVYNVSHLYVYKTDTKKSASTKASGDSGFLSLDMKSDGSTSSAAMKVALKEPTLSFISLSSKPDVLSSKKSARGEETDKEKWTSAFIDTKRSAVHAHVSSKRTVGSDSQDAGKNGDFSFPILGMEEKVGSTSPSVPFYPEPGIGKQKGKSALKRKLQSSEGSGEFISFKLSPTNVQTSVSNLNKAKKNKKKK